MLSVKLKVQQLMVKYPQYFVKNHFNHIVSMYFASSFYVFKIYSHTLLIPIKETYEMMITKTTVIILWANLKSSKLQII